MKRAHIAVDGASKGNPGHAGIGVVISDDAGKTVREISQYIGQATNNFAEYTALLRGLSEALDMGFTQASVQTDSELMAKQINGVYRVKNADMIQLFQTAMDLLGRFKSASVTHVLREKNKAADKLASAAAFSAGKPQSQEEKVGTAEETPMFCEKPAAPTAPPCPAPVDQPASRALRRRVGVHSQSRCQFVDITREVQEVVSDSGISTGICTVFVPHTTAGVTINENADPDVTRDIIDTLGRLIPKDPSYRHSEGNSDAHVKASMMGFSVQVFVEKGKLLLGTWQAIYFCEFDGPRMRNVFVRVD